MAMWHDTQKIHKQNMPLDTEQQMQKQLWWMSDYKGQNQNKAGHLKAKIRINVELISNAFFTR